MSGPDPSPGGVVVLLALGESQVLVQGLVSPASHYEGAVTQSVNWWSLVSSSHSPQCCRGHLVVVAASVKHGRDVGQPLPLVGGDAGVPQGLHTQPPGGVDPGPGISVSTSYQDSVFPVVTSEK